MLRGLFQEQENILRNTVPTNLIVVCIYINTYGIWLAHASQHYKQGKLVSMKNGVVSQVKHGPFIQASAWVSPASIPNSSNLLFLFPNTTLCKTYIARI
jgi:hypothetical protein